MNKESAGSWDRPPNILWICTDQQRGDTIGALGNRHIRTPHLNRLAAEGTSFTRAYCQSPICTPSRASFLTGRYASSVGCNANGNARWPETAPLIPKLLKDAGYRCGLAGKLHLADPRKLSTVLQGEAAEESVEPRPRDDGYEVFHWSPNSSDNRPQGHAYADWVRAQGEDLTALRKRLGYIPAELHQTRWCADRAIEFMEHDDGRPWLFSLNIFDPHPPFDPPPEYLERYDPNSLPPPAFRDSDLEAQAALEGVDFNLPCRRPEDFNAQEVKARYYAMIELVDEHVGRILKRLEATGQRRNTLVIFMSDHGEMMGDHGLLKKGCRFYEGLTRVPLIISQPGVVRCGIRCDDLVELTDLAPTLLEASGVESPGGLVGRSLGPVLAGGTSHGRRAVRCEYYYATEPNRGGRKHYRGSHATMYREERYKLVIYHGHPTGELFDLERDPDEFENLWADPAHRDLRERLTREAFDATVQGLHPVSGRMTVFGET